MKPFFSTRARSTRPPLPRLRSSARSPWIRRPCGGRPWSRTWLTCQLVPTPFAPAGTARAVRDAVRPYVGELLGSWGSADPRLDLALVVVSAAFPAEGAAITAQLCDWFDRSEPPLRTALGLALGFHGSVSEAVERIIQDQVGQSIRWAIITDEMIALNPHQSEFSKAAQEPYIDSPVPDAIQVANRLRAGAAEQTSDFDPLSRFVTTLMESGARLIDYPD